MYEEIYFLYRHIWWHRLPLLLFIVVCMYMYVDNMPQWIFGVFFSFSFLPFFHIITQLKHLITARHVEQERCSKDILYGDGGGGCMSWKKGSEREWIKERRKLIINGRLFMATKNLPNIMVEHHRQAAAAAVVASEHGRRQKIKKEVSMDRKLIIIIMLCASNTINYAIQCEHTCGCLHKRWKFSFFICLQHHFLHFINSFWWWCVYIKHLKRLRF